MIRKRCNTSGCARLVPTGQRHCAEHQAADNARRNTKSADHGLFDAAWRGRNGLRTRALERDAHLCQLRHPGCTGKATTVHLRPELAGDHTNATLTDCTSACSHCHGIEDGGRAHPGGRPIFESRQSPAMGVFPAQSVREPEELVFA